VTRHRWKDIADLNPGPSCEGCERLGRSISFDDCPSATEVDRAEYAEWQEVVRRDRKVKTAMLVLKELGVIEDRNYDMHVIEMDIPRLVAVFNGPTDDGDQVCRIHNADQDKPTAIFEGRWNSNLPRWKQGIVELATNLYQEAQVST